jgi:diguanylate cyclase (GGDEF)-like protein
VERGQSQGTDEQARVASNLLRGRVPGVAGIVLAILMASGLSWAEDLQADPAIARLQALRAAASASPGAVRELQQVEARLPVEMPYPLHRELIRTRLVVLDEGLDFEKRLALMQSLRDLAEANGDADTVSLMDIKRIFMSHADDNIGKYLDQLNAVSARIGSDASPEVMEALESSYGNMYFDAGNFDTALRHQLAALDWADKLDFGRERARLFRLSTISELYNTMELPDSALETIDRAFAQPGEIPVQNRISLLGTRALALMKKDELAAADKSLGEAEALARKDPSTYSSFRNGVARVELLLATALPEKAIEALQPIEAMATQKNDSYYLAKTAMLHGQALMQLDRVEPGLALMQKAYDDFVAKGQMVEVLDGLDRQIKVLREKRLFSRALERMERRQELWSQLFRNERGRAIAELEARHSAQDLEHRVDALSIENRIQEERLRTERLAKALALFVALFAMSLCALLFVAIRRARSERDTLSDAIRFDALTGASSRYQFQQRVQKAASTGPAATGLVLLDLDHFKSINDQFGHEAGDAVLKAVVECIRRVLGDSDELYRWGGEEFLVVLNRSDGVALERDVRRLLAEIESDPVPWHDQAMAVSVSGGYVHHPLAPGWHAPLEDAIRWADAALYLAKNAGRRRVEQVVLTEAGRTELLGRRPIDMPQLLDWQRRGYLQMRTLTLAS